MIKCNDCYFYNPQETNICDLMNPDVYYDHLRDCEECTFFKTRQEYFDSMKHSIELLRSKNLLEYSTALYPELIKVVKAYG